MTDEEISEDIRAKEEVLNFMLKNNINDVNDVGRIVSAYYDDKETVLEYMREKSRQQ